MSKIVDEIRLELEAKASEKLRESTQRFFKDQVKVYGLDSSSAKAMAKAHLPQVKALPKAEVFALCEELWRGGTLEEIGISCTWSEAIHKKYDKTDFKIFESWISLHVSNWAACDTFCNHTVGTLLEMYPEYLGELKRWAVSPNLWMRRASAVSLIVPAKRGLFLDTVFELADLLLEDREDMVQKGYGWLLKVASQAHEQEVFQYVMAHKNRMPRTALRYAIEKMPKELKARAMEK